MGSDIPDIDNNIRSGYYEVACKDALTKAIAAALKSEHKNAGNVKNALENAYKAAEKADESQKNVDSAEKALIFALSNPEYKKEPEKEPEIYEPSDSTSKDISQSSKEQSGITENTESKITENTENSKAENSDGCLYNGETDTETHPENSDTESSDESIKAEISVSMSEGKYPADNESAESTIKNQNSEKQSGNYLPYIILILCVIILASVILIIVLRRKKS